MGAVVYLKKRKDCFEIKKKKIETLKILSMGHGQLGTEEWMKKQLYQWKNVHRGELDHVWLADFTEVTETP